MSYARVIGAGDNVFVKLGTKEEYLYWRVFSSCHESEKGQGKKFYFCPEYAPGYEEWSQKPYWRQKIREWERRRDNALDFYIF